MCLVFLKPVFKKREPVVLSKIRRLMLLAATVMVLPVQAADYLKRTVCVWDIVGRGGPIAQAVEEFNLDP